MIRSLLIANRGEIACRVIRTARRLGIRTVAVYSDADATARHVRLADAAVRLGPAAPRDSYLNSAAQLHAARTQGADAVHPGYGFLSENAAFAAAVAGAGLVFVGPPAPVIAAMGSKSAAKSAMQAAGVPVLPGYHGSDQTLDGLAAAAATLGYPLIVKPSGGGGGKGMQIVSDAASLRPALETARRVAEGSFADPTLLLERYLPRPRHVEVQILADRHGHVLHLHDRDCSVQRRHQKLLEEAPAPGIPPAVRSRLHAAAVTVARSIGYENAGTVEFLYADGEFYFMEMNTRLQVEHPVTEAITGLDLVEWQLRVAAGEALPFAQHDVTVSGTAIEARVCAEDPNRDFAPSIGRFTRLDWPLANDGIRTDIGFEAGDVVPADYDSLLGKVIARAPERSAAVSHLARALAGLRCAGVTTNASWLATALQTETFLRGEVSTRFLDDEAEALSPPALDPERFGEAVAILCAALTRPVSAPLTPWSDADAFRVGGVRRQVVRGRLERVAFEASLERPARGPVRVTVTDRIHELEWHDLAAGQALVELGGQRRTVEFMPASSPAGHALLWIDDVPWAFEPEADAAGEGATTAADDLTARLPGTVTRVLVSEGDAVAAGETLLVVEAMKMEHAVRAPHAGWVARLHVRLGQRVTEGLRLVDVTADAAPVA